MPLGRYDQAWGLDSSLPEETLPNLRKARQIFLSPAWYGSEEDRLLSHERSLKFGCSANLAKLKTKPTNKRPPHQLERLKTTIT